MLKNKWKHGYLCLHSSFDTVSVCIWSVSEYGQWFINTEHHNAIIPPLLSAASDSELVFCSERGATIVGSVRIYCDVLQNEQRFASNE